MTHILMTHIKELVNLIFFYTKNRKKKGRGILDLCVGVEKQKEKTTWEDKLLILCLQTFSLALTPAAPNGL